MNHMKHRHLKIECNCLHSHQNLDPSPGMSSHIQQKCFWHKVSEDVKKKKSVFAGPLLCYRCPTHIAAIFDCLFSALFSWHALELTSSIYIQENMETEPHLPHLVHPRERERARQDDRRSRKCLKAQETPCTKKLFPSLDPTPSSPTSLTALPTHTLKHL